MTGPDGRPSTKAAELDRLVAEKRAREGRAGAETPAELRTAPGRPKTRRIAGKTAKEGSASDGAESAPCPNNAHTRDSTAGSAPTETGTNNARTRDLVVDYRETARTRVAAGGSWAGRADLADAARALRQSLGALGCSKHARRRAAGADLAAEAVTVLRELADRARLARADVDEQRIEQGRRLIAERGQGGA